MKLHANAALSLNKRRLLVHRVIEEGWSLIEAARAAEIERADRPQVGHPLSRRRRGRPARSPLGRPRRPQPHRRAAGLGDLRAAAAADDRRRDRRGPADGRDDGLGHPHALGLGQLGRLGLEPALRYERSAPGRADPHRRQEARPHPERRRASHHRRRHRGAPTPAFDATPSAGSSSTSASTTPPASPTSRSLPTRRRRRRSASCVAAWPTTAATGSRSRR